MGTLPQAHFFFRKMAPIFLEALNVYRACSRLHFSQKNGPHISGSPELVGTLPQAPFFPQKNGPHIFGSLQLVGTLPQALFFQNNGLHILEAPNLWVRCSRLFFSKKNGPHIFGVFGEPWLSTGGCVCELVR